MEKAIPVCPEELGGLATPRICSEIRGKRVFRKDGVEVTTEFYRGAKKALEIAKHINAKKAILKARSPSCGSDKIYDGTFSKKLINGNGIFALMCKKNRIEVISDEEFSSTKKQKLG